ncbi:MAG: CehA/McbA family metallohydrolase [Roseiflexaceae bacterium]
MTKQPLSKADLHLHTTYSDGHSTPAQLVQYVLQHTTLRMIAITDHDQIDGAYEAQKYAEGTGLHVIIGEEISTREGHLLAYFIQDRIRPGMSAHDTITAIHEQGGLAVAAHPYDWMVRSLGHFGLLKHAVEHHRFWNFDAIEALNASLRPRYANVRAAQAARTLNLPVIGGSDSHLLDTIGYGYTLFYGNSPAQLRQAIQSQQTSVDGTFWSMGDMAAAGTRLVQRTVTNMALRILPH